MGKNRCTFMAWVLLNNKRYIYNYYVFEFIYIAEIRLWLKAYLIIFDITMYSQLHFQIIDNHEYLMLKWISVLRQWKTIWFIGSFKITFMGWCSCYENCRKPQYYFHTAIVIFLYFNKFSAMILSSTKIHWLVCFCAFLNYCTIKENTKQFEHRDS